MISKDVEKETCVIVSTPLQEGSSHLMDTFTKRLGSPSLHAHELTENMLEEPMLSSELSRLDLLRSVFRT